MATPRSLFRLLPALAVGLLLSSGCSSGGGQGDLCTVDGDCGQGLMCDGGICLPAPTGCTSDEQCGGDKVCDITTHECVERIDTGCGGGSSCSADRYCTSDGRCKLIDEKSCNSNADCPVGWECNPVDGTCDDTCQAPEDCTGGQVCDFASGKCVACLADSNCTVEPMHACDTTSNSCVMCTRDSHCDDGYHCEYQQCLEGCTSSSQCDSPMFCDESLERCVECYADTPSMCTGGLVCNGDTYRCVECTADNHCGTNLVCNPSTNACVSCLEDVHCPLGNICENTACVPGCRTHDRCPAETPKCRMSDFTCVDCLSHGDCAPGTYCTEGDTCISGCVAGSSCEEGRHCLILDERCVDCLQDTHCVEGENRKHCDNTYSCRYMGMCEGPCTSDNQCSRTPDGDYSGAPIPSDVCISHVNLGGQDYPLFDTDMSTKICGLSCGGSSDCPRGYYCTFVDSANNDHRRQCVPGGLICDFEDQIGQPCASAMDCGPPSVWRCLGSPMTCTYRCLEDYHCPAGWSCDTGGLDPKYRCER